MRIALAFLLVIGLVSCGGTNPNTLTTPPAPKPPQLQVTDSVKILVAGLPVALTGLQTARAAGSLSNDQIISVENKILLPLAAAGKLIDAEVITSDDWPTMKAKLLSIIVNAGIVNVGASLPPTGQLILAAVISSYNTIAVAVGAPLLQ